VGGYGLNSSGSGVGPVAGCCEDGNEPSGFIRNVGNCFARTTLLRGEIS
jgi:hypothetical protein